MSEIFPDALRVGMKLQRLQLAGYFWNNCTIEHIQERPTFLNVYVTCSSTNANTVKMETEGKYKRAMIPLHREDKIKIYF